MSEIVVAAFYKFVALSEADCEALQAHLTAVCEREGVRGIVLVATEGVNGTIAGLRAGVDAVLADLRADARLNDLEHKESYTDKIPFRRLRVRVREEIVTLKAGANPNERVGTYVPPDEWNDLITAEDVIVIDTRNDFEAQMGTFKGAVNPETEAFSEFPAFVEEHLKPSQPKRVAMFCTGGIRCEKATSYLLSQGFEAVYHLRGGILKYLEEVPADESLWEGDCFVFDERVALDHNLQPTGDADKREKSL